MALRPNLFSNMEFPTYSFKEFPKIIQLPDGSRVTVHDKSHELRILADPPKSPLEPHPAEKERDELANSLAASQSKIAELEAKLAEGGKGKDLGNLLGPKTNPALKPDLDSKPDPAVSLAVKSA